MNLRINQNVALEHLRQLHLTLYGAVSVSKLYDPRWVKLIESILIKEGNDEHVSPRKGFELSLHPAFTAFAKQESLPSRLASNLTALTALLATTEKDGKDIPVLAKQYLKMGTN